MKRLIDEQSGMLLLDKLVMEDARFQKIMEDGMVSEDEIRDQAERVVSLVKQLETELPEDHHDLVVDFVVALSVLQEIYRG